MYSFFVVEIQWSRISEVKDVGGGKRIFLNNYPEVAHSFYFYFTFDWTRLILYNNKHHFCTIAKSILTVPASHCTVSTRILSSTKCHFSLLKPHIAQFKENITLYFFFLSLHPASLMHKNPQRCKIIYGICIP